MNHLKVLSSPKIDALSIGFTEKGYLIGLKRNISKFKEIEFTLNYLENEDISWMFYDINDPIYFSNKSLSFALNQFLGEVQKKNNIFYFQYGLEIYTNSGSSSIDLSKLNYKFGGATVTCKTCGNLILKTNKSEINFTPFLSVGLKSRIGNRSSLNLNAGIQYLKFSNVYWYTDMKYSPPKFVDDRINEIVDDINKITFYPRVSLFYEYKL